MGEITEPLVDSEALVRFAIDQARHRVIATIPEAMAEDGHVWHRISKDNLLELFGGEGLPDWALIVHRFRGARGNWRWLVIRDTDGYVEARFGGLQYVEKLV